MDAVTLENLIKFLSPFLKNEAFLQYLRQRNQLVERFGSTVVEKVEFICFNLLSKNKDGYNYERIITLMEEITESSRTHRLKVELKKIFESELNTTTELVQFIQENQDIILRFIENDKTFSDEGVLEVNLKVSKIEDGNSYGIINSDRIIIDHF